ncbi:hypothetical protein [Roseateles sp. BYS78W]
MSLSLGGIISTAPMGSGMSCFSLDPMQALYSDALRATAEYRAAKERKSHLLAKTVQHEVGKTSLAHHLVVRSVAEDAVSARKSAALQRAAALGRLRSVRRSIASQAK